MEIIQFHSVPYTAKDKSTLEYWEYDKFGKHINLQALKVVLILKIIILKC